jgi:hypothetical protein
MNRNAKIAIGILVLIVILAAAVILFLTGSTSITLTIPYGAGAAVTYHQYTVGYGYCGSNDYTLYVWAGSSVHPESFPASINAVYHAYTLRIKINQVHQDYIVVQVSDSQRYVSLVSKNLEFLSVE